MAEPQKNPFHALLRVWNKTSLMTRLVVGAAIAVVILKSAEKFLLLPIQVKREAVEAKLVQTQVDPNHDANMQFRSYRLNQSRHKTETLRRKVAEESSVLYQSAAAPLLGKIRAAFNENAIKILKETNLKSAGQLEPEQNIYTPGLPVPRRTPTPAALPQNTFLSPDATALMPPPVLPPSLGCSAYHFKVYGTFGAIHRFINTLDGIPGVFFVQDIKLERIAETVPNAEGIEVQAVGLGFTLYVPYLAEEGK